MDKIVCKYCGTNYPGDVAKCPVCGASNAPSVADGFAFLDLDEEFEAKPSGDEDVKVFSAAKEEEREEAKAKAVPAPMPSYEKKEEKNPDPPRPQRSERKKSGGALKVVLLLLLVAGLLAAVFFAAKATGLFDKQEPAEEPQDGDSLELPVEDLDVPCAGISLDMAELTMTEAGATQKLTVTVEPEGCTDKVNWISSFPEVASVDATGLVTAVSEGSVNILVTCGDYAASCLVTVDLTPEEEEVPEEQEQQEEQPEGEEPVEEEDTTVGLNYTDVTLFNPGEKLQLSVKNLPEGETVTWSADSDVIVSVDDTGLVTATATGTCNVYAEVGGEKYSCIVRCNLGTPEGEKITVTLNVTDITLFYEGEQYRLEVGYTTEEIPENTTYEWTSSDEEVCTVDECGTVTAVANGTATVTADVDGVQLKCTVRVNIPDEEDTESTEETSTEG